MGPDQPKNANVAVVRDHTAFQWQSCTLQVEHLAREMLKVNVASSILGMVCAVCFMQAEKLHSWISFLDTKTVEREENTV